MGLPVDLTTIIITGTYTDLAGNPLSGTISFGTGQVITDRTGRVILGFGRIPIKLNNQGKFSVVLPCSDNATLSPTNFQYQIAENISGVRRSFSVAIPSTLGPTVDISQLTLAQH